MSDMYNRFPRAVCSSAQLLYVLYQYRDHLGIARQMKNKIVFYANLQKTFFILFPHKDCFQRVVEIEYLFEGDFPHHAIVYIPTADLGQNTRHRVKLGY